MSSRRHMIVTPGGSRKRKEREGLSSGEEPTLEKNGLLAGYMAYEFRTRGTLLGQRFDSARAEAVILAPSTAESRRTKKEREEARAKKEHQNYAEVASILKTEGAHVPGIVNPTQLAGWIQM